MSIIGKTWPESRSKTYNTVPAYLPRNKTERKVTKQVTDLMRACNGYPWTPALERAVENGDVNRIVDLLSIPNP